MGHNIFAIKNGKVVAELRIGGKARRETRLYDVLGVPKFNRKDSGSGESAMFTNLMLAGAMRTSETKGPYLPHREFFFLDECMKAIALVWSRETLLEAIKEAADFWQSVQPATVSDSVGIYTDLKMLSFVFLEKFCLVPEEVTLFRDLLTESDLDVLKNINSYNYYKIKMKK